MIDVMQAVLDNPQNRWVLGCFALFLALPVIFAFLYRRLYRENEANFFFPQDALFEFRRQTQKERILVRRAQLERNIEAVIPLVEYVSQHPEQLSASSECIKVKLPDGRQYRVEFDEHPNPSQTDVYITTRLTVLDSAGNSLHSTWLERGGFGIAPEPPAFCNALNDHCAEWQITLGKVDATIRTLDSSRALWSFEDFLYFSVLTQTTLGCGDIVAASSVVRRLVIMQMSLAFGILVVLVNVVVLSR